MTDGLSIVEQIGIVSQQGQCEFQTVLMWVCIFALAGLGAFFGLLLLGKACKAYVDRLKRHGRIGGILLGALTVYMILYGGTKPDAPKWRFEYANGLTDNGSYCTNDQIRAAWTYNVAAMEYTIRAAYQNLTITNSTGQCTDPLHELPECLVKDGSHLWTVADATNMRVVVYATYVPPPVVHTNGVYHLGGVMPTMEGTGKYVTPGVKTIVFRTSGGEIVITPTNEPPASASLLQTLVNETTGETEP